MIGVGVFDCVVGGMVFSWRSPGVSVVDKVFSLFRLEVLGFWKCSL